MYTSRNALHSDYYTDMLKCVWCVCMHCVCSVLCVLHLFMDACVCFGYVQAYVCVVCVHVRVYGCVLYVSVRMCMYVCVLHVRVCVHACVCVHMILLVTTTILLEVHKDIRYYTKPVTV